MVRPLALRLLLALTLSLALAGAGAQHRPPERADEAAAMAAFVALGGSSDDLCRDIQGPLPHGKADCPACTLGAGLAMPPASACLIDRIGGTRPLPVLARLVLPGRAASGLPPATGPPHHA